MKTLRNCKLCGKQFLANGKNLYCSNKHYNTCKVCGKKFEVEDVHYPKQTCSKECARILRKENAQKTSLELYGVINAGGTAESKAKTNATCRAKYGVDWPGQAEIQKQHVAETFAKNGGNPQQREEVKEKTRQTCIERYGAPSVFSKDSNIREQLLEAAEKKYGTRDPGNLPQFREKAKQTSIKKYGTEYFMQSEQGREAREQGMLKKYGVTHSMQSEELVQKYCNTMIERYGVPFPTQSPVIMQKISDIIMEKYGVPYYCLHPNCREAQGTQPSRIAAEFANKILDNTGLSVEYEYVIGKKSFDIHVVDTNILIEIDPSYTHTTIDVAKFGSIKQSYHKDKSALAEENGFVCIHVFDWDNPEKVLNIIAPKEKIYARNCTIKKIDVKEANAFLDQYHLQNRCKGQTYCYGLFYKDELVEVMTFGKPRYNNKVEWELLRLCTRPKLNVLGGANKLFKKFIDEVNPQSIVSYCDKSKFRGDVYYRLGFTLEDKGDPSRHWSNGKKHITDNLLRQRGYDQLFNTNYGKGVSNEQLMLENHWLPVYDCGQARFEWRAT